MVQVCLNVFVFWWEVLSRFDYFLSTRFSFFTSGMSSLVGGEGGRVFFVMFGLMFPISLLSFIVFFFIVCRGLVLDSEYR